MGATANFAANHFGEQEDCLVCHQIGGGWCNAHDHVYVPAGVLPPEGSRVDPLTFPDHPINPFVVNAQPKGVWELDMAKAEEVVLSGVLKERGERYGEFARHATLTQELKSVMRACANWDYLNVSQKECLEMIAHKIGRILAGDPDYVDSWLDIAGYAQLVYNQLVKKGNNG